MQIARLIHRADIFAARLSPRRQRAALSGMAAAEGVGRLGKWEIQLLRAEESSPEEATGLLVPRREAAGAFQRRFQIRRSDTKIGGQTVETGPGLGEKICEVEARQVPLLPATRSREAPMASRPQPRRPFRCRKVLGAAPCGAHRLRAVEE
jgi:hypothetical protein